MNMQQRIRERIESYGMDYENAKNLSYDLIYLIEYHAKKPVSPVKKAPGTGMLTITGYARREGISRQATLWRITHDKIRAQKVGNTWIILEGIDEI